MKAHTTLPDRDLVDTDLVLSSYLLWKQDQVLGRDCQHDHQQEDHGVLQGDPHRQALGGAHQRQGGCFSVKPEINLKEFIQFEIVRLSPVDAKTK